MTDETSNLNNDILVNLDKQEVLPANVLIPKTTTNLTRSNVLSNDITIPVEDAVRLSNEEGGDMHLRLHISQPAVTAIDFPLKDNESSHDGVKTEAQVQEDNQFDEEGEIDSNDKIVNDKPQSNSLVFNISNNANAKRSSIYESKSVVKAIPIRNKSYRESNDYGIFNSKADDQMSIGTASSMINKSLSKSFLFSFYNIYKQNSTKKPKAILSKEYWMKDENVKECFICNKIFNTFRRKHHCRLCGQIFCNACTISINGEKFGYDGLIKICKNCSYHLETYDDSSDEDINDSNNKKIPYENLNTQHTNSLTLKNGANSEENSAEEHQQEIYILNNDGDDIQSIITTKNNGDESNVFLSTPPLPPPKMTIPATRQGESLEIFSNFDTARSNATMKKGSIESISGNGLFRERSGVKDFGNYSKQIHHTTPNDSNYVDGYYQNLRNANSSSFMSTTPIKAKKRNSTSTLRRSIFNYVSGNKSPQDKDGNSTSYPKKDYELDQSQLSHSRLGKKNFQFEFNYNFNEPSTLPDLKSNNNWKTTNGFENDADDVSSEDEGSMSLYSSLNDIKQRDNNLIRSMRNSTKSSERAEASLQRIRYRRKSRSKTLHNGNQNLMRKNINFLANSTPNLVSVIDDDDESYSGKATMDATGDARSITRVSSNAYNLNSRVKPLKNDNNHKRNSGLSLMNNQSEKKTDLNEVSLMHLQSLLEQVINDQEIDNKGLWIEILSTFLAKVQQIRINIRDLNTLDYRQYYVKIKRIAGGSIQQSEYLNGIVFSKSLPMKEMPRFIFNPRIMVLMFPLEYNRNDSQLLSIESLLTQERDYLNKLITRVTYLQPDVIFVGANVSGYALELLTKAGVVVQFNIKPQVIERIAKLTEADIAISVDKLAVNVKMGECEQFEVKTYVYGNISKSYTYLRGCNSTLGGTILLRGASDDVLQNLKQVTEFMVYVAISLKLESSLFKDSLIQLSKKYYLESKDKRENCTETGYFSDFLNKLNKRMLSISPTVEFPMPFLLDRARALEKAIIQKKEEQSKFMEDIDLMNVKNILPPDIEFKLARDDVKNLARYVHEKHTEDLESQFKRRSRQWELFYAQSHNILGTGSHQSITVLYSMVSTKTATPCIGPQIVTIDYFWDSDITIGQFIENIVATAMYPCQQGCNSLLIDHYRSYVHGSGKVDVSIEVAQTKFARLTDITLTWTYCKSCNTFSPIFQMSQKTWNFSFGKYLEILYWSNEQCAIQVGNCSHSFTKNHVIFFGHNDLVIRMEYTDIEVYELVTPPRKIVWKAHKDIKLKVELYYNILDRINSFYGSVKSRLEKINLDSISADKNEDGKALLATFVNKVELEKSSLLTNLDKLYKESLGDSHLQLNGILKKLVENAALWHHDFTNFANSFMPSEKDISLITTNQLKKIFSRNNDNHTLSSTQSEKENVFSETSKNKVDTSTPAHSLSNCSEQNAIVAIQTDQKNLAKESNDVNDSDKESTNSANSSYEVNEQNVLKKNYDKSLSINVAKKDLNIEFETSRSFDSMTKKEHSLDSKVGQLASFFDQLHIDALSKEFELQRELERLNSNKTKYKSHKLQASKPIVDIYKNVNDAVDEPLHDKNFSNDEVGNESKLNAVDKGNCFGNQKLNHELENELENSIHQWGERQFNADNNIAKSSVASEAFSAANEEAITKFEDEAKLQRTTQSDATAQPEKSVLIKALSNFWADRSATSWKQLEFPTTAAEHLFPESNVIVREDEPSSLMAFCLSIPDYKKKMSYINDCEFSVNARQDTSTNQSNSDRTNQNLDLENEKISGTDIDFMTFPNESNEDIPPHSDISQGHIDEAEFLDKIMLKNKALHLRYQFQDQETVMSCKIFFAEHFEAFRKICGCDEKFIQSLSRCVKWDSSGGKSGSGFLKTLDDRFVIKQLSNSELDAFVKFAPSYFEYMSQAMFHELPTSLVKILGFYQIQIKNSSTSNNYKMDLIIMENLFYEKKTTRIFDLKGSMRNRHVEQTGKENEVLLDENMVEYIYESPIHVREYDKKLLRASLWNDTLFLAKMNVMDYSLVIGIDSDGHILTAGIIDFIRTFTWDKKLESWVKEKGLVGGAGTKQPTVVTPRQYKNRFREAMERYILMVPDPWYQEST